MEVTERVSKVDLQTEKKALIYLLSTVHFLPAASEWRSFAGWCGWPRSHESAPPPRVHPCSREAVTNILNVNISTAEEDYSPVENISRCGSSMQGPILASTQHRLE